MRLIAPRGLLESVLHRTVAMSCAIACVLALLIPSAPAHAAAAPGVPSARG